MPDETWYHHADGRPYTLIEMVGTIIYEYMAEDESVLERPYSCAKVIVDVLSAAGRLLPEGGETRTEWGVGPDPANVQISLGVGPEHARNLAAIRGSCMFRRLVGPWVAVDQETTDG